jgi:hypothetical protein
VREDEGSGINSLIPSDDPLPVSVDNPGWFGRSDDELKLSDVLGAAIIMGNRILTGEDMVEVDGTPRDEVGPL